MRAKGYRASICVMTCSRISDMARLYQSEARAFERQQKLAQNYGIFSGVQRVVSKDGTVRYRLFYNPDAVDLM